MERENGPELKRRRVVVAQLRTLNEQFAGWIQDQKLHHLEDVWIDGAEDYIQHARSLLQELADDNKTLINGSSGAPKSDSGMGFGSPSSDLQAEKVQGNGEKPAVNASSGALSFLGGSTAAPSLSIGGAAQATSGAMMSFPAFGASAAPFSQNISSSSALTNGSGFSWSTGATGGQDGTAKSTPVSGGAADEDGAEGEGPKVFTPEVTLSEGSKLLFKETAKLYLKPPDKATWDDRGSGTLTVRQQLEEDGAGSAPSANIVFTTESGRILVNGGVYKGIKLNPAKKPSMVVTNLTLATEEGADKEVKLTTMLFNLGNVEKANKFKSVVEGVTPK
ncbi:hypothetical protein COCOBI_06-4680 [Coccomyxa sp. Obi]|nr:hypothetical protein COCOBI_06-4680 [Coccomyxa sp. Obi]